jgi:hypothetical protein
MGAPPPVADSSGPLRGPYEACECEWARDLGTDECRARPAFERSCELPVLEAEKILRQRLTARDQGKPTGGLVDDYKARRLEEKAKPATINSEVVCQRRMFRLGVRAGRVVQRPEIVLLAGKQAARVLRARRA